MYRITGDGDASKLEDYVSSQYNMTLDEVRQEWKSGMEKNISHGVYHRCDRSKRGHRASEDGFSSYVQTLMSNNSLSSEDDLYKNYGYGDAAYGEKYLRQVYVDNLALQSVKDNADVTVEAPAETESTRGHRECRTGRKLSTLPRQKQQINEINIPKEDQRDGDWRIQLWIW